MNKVMPEKKAPVIAKEPFIRIIKRDSLPFYKASLFRLIAVLAALILDALFVYLVIGLNPLSVFSTMFRGTFGNSIYAWGTLIAAIKLLCIAVALAPAFKMRFWNIGAEGQVLAGALAAAIIMVYFGNTLPSWLLFLTMTLGSILAGAIWAFFPAFFKAKYNTNETLFTLMMNYIAMKIVDYFYNFWKGTASSLGKLNKATEAGYFPKILGRSYTINIIVTLVLVVLMFLYLKYTKHGYEISVVGESQKTAQYAGINVKKVIIRTMLISGAVCGICGFMTVAGQDQSISSTTTTSGYGFTAIIVAWMAKFNTFYMAIISLFIAFLERGTRLIASTYQNFNDSASNIIIGVILFFLIGCEFFLNYKLIFRSGRHKEG